MDNAVNVLDNVREIPIDEIIDHNDLYAIPVLRVRGSHGVGFA